MPMTIGQAVMGEAAFDLSHGRIANHRAVRFRFGCNWQVPRITTGAGG
jgi:hypothetical protein